MSATLRSQPPAAEVAEVVPLEAEGWEAALAASGRPYRFSHRAAAGRALEAAYPSHRFTPYRVDYRDGARILYPLVTAARPIQSLSKLVGMPLGLEGTPIALAGELRGAHLEGLLRALDFKGSLHIHGGAGGSPPAVGLVTSHLTHVLDLRGGFDAVWSRAFDAKTRNMCRKAERAGVRVAEETTPAALVAYYELYAKSAAAWGYSEPPYPRRLFEALLGSGAAELWLARLGGAPVAGAMFLRGSEDLLYWSAAVDREHRGAAPSNAVMRAAISSACERGVAYLDFGASTGLPGVEAFKRSFGAQPRDYRVVNTASTRQRRLRRWENRLRSGRGTRR